jgi:hypothetical protein
MCEVNWPLLIEFFKIVLGWPPVALAIALLFFWRFRVAIHGLLGRVTEGSLLGQTFKAAPPSEQRKELIGAPVDRLAKAAEAHATRDNAAPGEQVSLPPELQNDPHARNAVAYIRNNPTEVLIEYKRLLFSYNSERLFNAIYGTQISLLVFLASRPTEAVAVPELATFHATHQVSVGRTDYQLMDYLGFLSSFGVIAPEGTPERVSYRITQSGVEFLSYIKAAYPTAWTQRAF